MQVAVIYTIRHVGEGLLSSVTAALEAFGGSVVTSHGVQSAFDLPSAVLSLKQNLGSDVLYFVLGVVQGEQGVDSGSAALSLMSVRAVQRCFGLAGCYQAKRHARPSLLRYTDLVGHCGPRRN